MSKKAKQLQSLKTYSSFDQINGHHPLKDVNKDCFIDYPARSRKGGKVIAFNYDLARELGLIGVNHPNQMNPELEEKILETFGIVIINEYDQIHNTRFAEKDIKENSYMATRYLQMQHPNKQGKTSGDGRSIWNGYITHKGKIYDISSCGTGATSLSPATNIKKKFFKTGDPSISYGCGHSEVDEGMGTLFFSEIMHRNHIPTERILAIIDYGKNIGITVRAHENLLRPAHFFNHLKQDNLDTLKKMIAYHIDRQIHNGEWKDVPKNEKKRMEYFLQKQSKVFAEIAARFEDDYIFCWMDWDGDNIMMNGGIIDYGSIRQFGLYHSEYRYDDVERYSTSIVEQKAKARYIVQTFAQMIDFVITKEKSPIKDFANSQAVSSFDHFFRHYKLINLAHKIGLNKKQIDYLLEKHSNKLDQFRKIFHYFESAKSIKGPEKVADGINWNAIFCMRDILRELPQLYLMNNKKITHSEFIDIIKSNYALPKDLNLTGYRRKKISEYQERYWEILEIISRYEKVSLKKILLEVTMRSSVINKYDRVTGDSITDAVDKILTTRPKPASDEIYVLLKEFTEYQNLVPENKKGVNRKRLTNSKIMKNIFKIVRDYREGL